jgi:hypothetical protein
MLEHYLVKDMSQNNSNIYLMINVEFLSLLDKFADCFEETPVLCCFAEHANYVTHELKPKQLREYRAPEHLKPEVNR